jgi:hypothetical protein
MSSRTDQIIIFSLASILSVSLLLHAYFMGNAFWRWRQERAAAAKRLMQVQNP